MVLALLVLAAAADWVPARWPSSDPKTLDLLRRTPVNCLLLEANAWSEAFARSAGAAGIITLGVVRPGGDADAAAAAALKSGLTGLVLEGDFSAEERGKLAASKLTLVELPSRARMRFDADIAGTFQGVWPGIIVQKDGAAKAAPTGAPWVETNTGFLRFVKAVTKSPVWIANCPPPGQVIRLARYLQAIGDAGAAGARWVVALDQSLAERLVKGDPEAARDWQRIGAHLRFYEEHRDWAELPPHGQLALIEDVDSGALLSGGIYDMMAARHTPVRPVPARSLDDAAMRGARLAINVDAASVPENRRESLRAFTRGGGTLLTGPPEFRMPAPQPGKITLSKEELDRIDAMWREINSMTGRRNLGARLFNVSSMLSNLTAAPDGKRVVLHLVNYSGYPVDNVTVHLLGKYTRARLMAPEQDPKDLQVYPTEEGTGLEIDKVASLAAVVID